MIRKFTAEDITHFPEIQILRYKSSNNIYKDYLIIKRKDFISCFVTIDNNTGIFVEQYRPVIKKQTLEVPMGKIEPSDSNPDNAVFRELEEEINLTVKPQPHILIKNRNTGVVSSLYFSEWKIEYLGFEYPSPGFSDYKNYRYWLQLYTIGENFYCSMTEYDLFSQEPQLKVTIKKLDEKLLDEIYGISRHYLMDFLYHYKK